MYFARRQTAELRRGHGQLGGHNLAEAGIPARIMIDFSHGNSGKDPQKQVEVGREVAIQIADGMNEFLA